MFNIVKNIIKDIIFLNNKTKLKIRRKNNMRTRLVIFMLNRREKNDKMRKFNEGI